MKIFHAAATQAKAFLQLGTENARQMVRTILKSHPAVGLRVQDIYTRLREQFPEAKEKVFTAPKSGLTLPSESEHPLGSMRYLKKVVIPEMEKAGEIHKVHIKRGGGWEVDGKRLDHVNYKKHGGQCVLPTDVTLAQEWRWRLTPKSVPEEMPDQ